MARGIRLTLVWIGFLTQTFCTPGADKSGPGFPTDLSSSQVVNETDFKEGWPLVSIVVDESHLRGPDGILRNPNARGQKWEKHATVSYYENKKLIFSTAAGLRLHGGSTRNEKLERSSFRLYFRKEYGAKQFAKGVLFGPETGPLKRLVVHYANPVNAPFATPLAFDIVRQIGGRAPEAKPALVLLNGKSMGIYWLSEHIGRKQWASHFGHNDFILYRYKGDNLENDTKAYQELTQWAKNQDIKMTMKEAGKYIDIDNWSRYIFSIGFCETVDAFQGSAVLDKRRPGAKWLLVNWDMESSFPDIVMRKRHRKAGKRGHYIKYVITNRHYLQSYLLRRLLYEDSEYKDYYIRMAMNLMNHRLTEEFLNNRIDYYAGMEKMLDDQKPSTLARIRGYLNRRPATARKEMEKHFQAGRSYPCEVKGPDETNYRIDGYPEKSGYTGWYFSGLPITIEVTGANRNDFSHWIVNSKKITSKQLVYPIHSKTKITAIFRQSRLARTTKAPHPL